MANQDKSFITTGEKARNFVGIAVLISVLLHVALVPLVPRQGAHDEDKTETVSVTHKIKVKVHTPPPPTPTPPPTPPPQQQTPPPKQQPVQPKLKLNVPKTSSNSSTSSNETQYHAPTSGSENGVPAGTGTAAPAPTEAPKPSCPVPNKAAYAVSTAEAEYPSAVADLGLGPTYAQVQVYLSADSKLTSATIYHSSGNSQLDQSALRSARQSTYQASLVNCVPTAGTYLFRVDFNADQ